MATWESAVDVPFTPIAEHFFSPILSSGGDLIVFVLARGNETFWSYNITRRIWTQLTNSASAGAAHPLGGMALSPDWSTLAVTPATNFFIHFYDISGDGWTVSADCPTPAGGTKVALRGVVWEDNDTLWAFLRYTDGGQTRLKCMKLVKSTNTWSEFTNHLVVTTAAPQAVSINTLLTAVYIGYGELSKIHKYVISTDGYSTINAGSGRPVWCSDRYARIWWYDQTSFITYYFDCDEEANVTSRAIDNPSRDNTDNLITYGVALGAIGKLIAYHKLTNPADWIIDVSVGTFKAPYSQAHIIG